MWSVHPRTNVSWCWLQHHVAAMFLGSLLIADVASTYVTQASVHKRCVCLQNHHATGPIQDDRAGKQDAQDLMCGRVCAVTTHAAPVEVSE